MSLAQGDDTPHGQQIFFPPVENTEVPLNSAGTNFPTVATNSLLSLVATVLWLV